MQRLKNFDWLLLVLPFILCLLSITTIYTITYNSVGPKLAISQLIYTLIGLGLLVGFAFFDYRHFRSLSWILFGIGLVLLLPMLPLWSHKIPFVICEFNACRWLNLGFFQFQTSELFKVIIILLLASSLSANQGRTKWWQLFAYLAILALPAWLIMSQPDLGTMIVVLFCGLVLLIVNRFPMWAWIVLIIGGMVVFPVVWQNLKSYQKQRIEIFLNPNLDPNKTGYNVRQAEIAVGSGGVSGRGFGKGSQSQLNFLPVAHTDFIFAGLAEATGFIGSVLLIFIYVLLIWRILVIAQLAKDFFGRYVALGLGALFAVQAFINIAMNIRLMPVTGIPLPLISYGGTSLFISMIALGILQSIVTRHRKLDFR